MPYYKIIIALIIGVCLSGLQQVTSQNPKAQGYMGLWSQSVPVTDGVSLYAGGMGTFSSLHRPLAIYSPEVRKTFFIYSGTRKPEESHLQIMISYFDHKTQKVPKPVIVYDKQGVNDPQDNGSLSIDSDGYLWVFISGRGRTRPGLIFKSTLPWSIENFEQVYEGELVFPQPWWVKDSCFFLLHTRVSKGRELFWSVSSDGKNWTESQKIAGMGGHSQISGINQDVIYTVFSYYPGGNRDRRTNLYMLKSEDMGGTWRNASGETLSMPLTEIKNLALVRDFESEKRFVFLCDLNFDSQGNPVILAIISNDFRPGPTGDPRELTVIRWKEGKWNFTTVCTTDHNYDMGTLLIRQDEWHIVSSTGAGPQEEKIGGEIVLWTSRDEGIKWEQTKGITNQSAVNNTYPRRAFNGEKGFNVFWTDGDAEKLSESHIYFTDDRGDKVWMLPYKMEKEFEKPLRIK